jgi:hypothetical protein
MGLKRVQEYDFEKMEKDMPDLKFLSFNCPHCTDDKGKFSEIVLYVPKSDEYQIATQCNCNGQESRCTVLLTLMQTYNSEKLLKKLNE